LKVKATLPGKLSGSAARTVRMSTAATPPVLSPVASVSRVTPGATQEVSTTVNSSSATSFDCALSPNELTAVTA
jgi:hypothetical protein